MQLLTNARSNPKTKKMLDTLCLEAVILHLAPHSLADGKHTVCPWSTVGCRMVCLNHAGRGQMDSVQNARIAKTNWYLQGTPAFLNQLNNELGNLNNRAIKKNLTAVARLNGTSDLQWENHGIIKEWEDVIKFYDYTKSFKRAMEQPYYLVYSRTEHTTDEQIWELAKNGINTAVVFNKFLPDEFLGLEVMDGTVHDFRYLDPKGIIVGLVAKGRAHHPIHTKSDFVVSEFDFRCGSALLLDDPE